MTETETAIAALLAHKAELDRRNTDALNLVPYDRWIADALEALLKTIAVRVAAAQSPAKP
jgi:hypothetical protein